MSALPELSPDVGPSLLGNGLDLDASSVDHNLRAIRQVESSWRLPGLPDSVKMDLATMPGMQPSTISRFLTGLDRDAHNENPEDFQPVQPPMPALTVVNRLAPYTEQEADAFTEATATISTLRGLPETDVLDLNAVQRLKMRAIERGLMDAPEDGIIDGGWSPEMSTIQRELQRQEANDFYRGQKPGSVPITKALQVLEDWTSPGGLMRMAVNLDLIIDPGAVAGEFQSWGDKWRKVGKSKNPLDFGKNLIDAMTGPIDDIVVPVLNMALLFSGVGSAYNFARVGVIGARGAAAIESFNAATNLYKVPKALAWTERIFPALSTADAAGEAYQGLQQASWLASRLRQGGSTAKAAGDAMAKWRAWRPVVQTKNIVQTGARLGIISQAEDRLLPGYQGGLSLGDTGIVEAVGSALPASGATPWIRTVGEAVLTPYTFFAPGTFTGTGRQALQGTFQLLGTTPGRAAAGAVVGAGVGTVTGDDAGDVLQGAAIGGALGAAAPHAGKAIRDLSTKAGELAPALQPVSKLVRRTGEALAKTSWSAMADDQRATATFFEAMRRHLPEEEFGAFADRVKQAGFKRALGERYGIEGDDRSVGGLMSYVFVSASIDRTAALQAGIRSEGGWQQRYWLARNKLTAQLRAFDPATVTPQELAWAAVSKDMSTRRGLASRFREKLAEYERLTEADPNALAELVSAHNQQAALTMRQLLSSENLPLNDLDDVSRRNLAPLLAEDPEARWSGVADYIATTLDSFGNWTKYAPATTELGQKIEAGLLLDARLRAPVNLKGQALSQLEMLDEWQPPVLGDEAHADWYQQLSDTLFLDGKSTEEWRRSGGYMTPFARELDPSRSRFTLARVETASKHELIEAADELKQTIETVNAVRRISKLEGKRTAALLRDAQAAGRILSEEDLAAARVDLSQLGKLSRRQMSEFTKALGLGGKSADAKALRQLNWFAKHHGITVDDAIEQTVRQVIEELNVDPRWSERYGLELFPSEAVTAADGTVTGGRRLEGLEVLEKRRKDLIEKAKYTAAEVDVDDLIAQHRAAGRHAEADELAAWAGHVKSQGYKVVYGAEFLSPDDLLNRTGVFDDINERHLNAMTLGNFFGRKQPEALRLAAERSQRASLAQHLSTVRGETVAPDSELVDRALRELYQYVLDPAQAAGKAMLQDLQHQNWLRRRMTGVATNDVPLSLQDLGAGRNRKRIMEVMVGLGWSDQEAAAIWQGLKEGRHAEWQDLGLAALEAKLRGKNQLIDALHVLGGTSNSSVLKRTAVGAVAGAGVAAVEGEDLEKGALAGAVGGAATSGVALGRVTERVTDAIDYSKWARYGYLADNLANLRDRLRFTLSPWFDISRYTEAQFLSLTGGPKRLPSGERVATPLIQTPRGLRRKWAKELRDVKGLSPQEAQNAANRQFNLLIDEFKKVARGTDGLGFDPDAVESTAQWFSQIGIMGFNPTAYMATSYHHLKEAGLAPEAAWKAVKEMHSYGTTGRSAAELSANFIFFPFSFQKKAIKHAASWLADDMVRSVLIHDALKAYEMLDERYDLGQVMQDHFPVLEKLQQLNMFAFGLSPGVLGGINAPYLNTLVGNPASDDPAERGLILNLFTPQGIDVGNAVKSTDYQKVMRRTIPAIYDLQHLIEDAKQQGHVVFDPSHQTTWAQARDAYSEWDEVKRGVSEALKAKGYTWGQLARREELAPLNDYYVSKRLELEQRYPGWKQARERSLERIFERNQALRNRLDTARLFPHEASTTDLQLLEFDSVFQAVSDQLGSQGFSEVEDWDPEVLNQLRAMAIGMAKVNPNFRLVYDEFYGLRLGSISTSIGR